MSLFRLVRLEDGIHDREQRISESVISGPKEQRVHVNDGSFQRNCKPSTRQDICLATSQVAVMHSRAYHLIRGGGSKVLTFAHDVLRNPDLQSLLFWRIVDLIDAVKIISNVASSGLVIWVVIS